MSEQVPSNEKVARLRAVFDDRSKEFRRSHAEALFNEFANLERRLDAREELIDGYEKQLGIAEVDATITIGSEIARLLEIEKRATAEPLPGHAAWERERMAKWISKNKPSLPDHACAQCVPGGEIVVEDFECVYHMALKIAEEAVIRDKFSAHLALTKGDSP